jgi:hypothetical protein
MKSILEKLENKQKEYLEDVKKLRDEGLRDDYWRGKASGILLAIEILQGKM